MGKVYFLLICVFIIFTNIGLAADSPDKDKGKQILNFEKGLKSENLRERIETAKKIAKSELDKETKAKLVLDALREEHLNPKSNELERWTGYYTRTEALKNGYILALKDMGKSIVPLLMETYKEEKGELREKIVIILGYIGDAVVFNDLLEIISKTKNHYTKAQAIRALSDSGLGGREFIALYKEALKDDFYVRPKSDLIFPPEQDYLNVYYPVREEAFSALKKLGVDVRRHKNEFYIYSPE